MPRAVGPMGASDAQQTKRAPVVRSGSRRLSGPPAIRSTDGSISGARDEGECVAPVQGVVDSDIRVAERPHVSDVVMVAASIDLDRHFMHEMIEKMRVRHQRLAVFVHFGPHPFGCIFPFIRTARMVCTLYDNWRHQMVAFHGERHPSAHRQDAGAGLRRPAVAGFGGREYPRPAAVAVTSFGVLDLIEEIVGSIRCGERGAA